MGAYGLMVLGRDGRVEDTFIMQFVQARLRTSQDSHGARPVHLVITMIKWIWTSRLSIKNCLSREGRRRGGGRTIPEAEQGIRAARR